MMKARAMMPNNLIDFGKAVCRLALILFIKSVCQLALMMIAKAVVLNFSAEGSGSCAY